MSTYKQRYNKKFGFEKDAAHSLSDIAKTTKVKKSVLQKVYNRGVGAHKTNPQSVRLKSGKKAPSAPISKKMSKEQWGKARVYAFVMGGKTSKTADKDLYKVRKKV